MTEIPKEAIAVASPVSYFLDDVVGACRDCGRTVYTRPHTPRSIPRVCPDCYARVATPDDEAIVTPETLAELRRCRALYGARPMGRPS